MMVEHVQAAVEEPTNARITNQEAMSEIGHPSMLQCGLQVLQVGLVSLSLIAFSLWLVRKLLLQHRA